MLVLLAANDQIEIKGFFIQDVTFIYIFLISRCCFLKKKFQVTCCYLLCKKREETSCSIIKTQAQNGHK